MGKVNKYEKRRTGSAIYCAGLDAGILAFKLGEIKDILTEREEDKAADIAAQLQEEAQKLERKINNFFNDYNQGRC